MWRATLAAVCWRAFLAKITRDPALFSRVFRTNYRRTSMALCLLVEHKNSIVDLHSAHKHQKMPRRVRKKDAAHFYPRDAIC